MSVDFGGSEDQFAFANVTLGSTSPSGTSAAPEPGTWALIFGGLAMIGGMLRIANARRRENEVAGIATA